MFTTTVTTLWMLAPLASLRILNARSSYTTPECFLLRFPFTAKVTLPAITAVPGYYAYAVPPSMQSLQWLDIPPVQYPATAVTAY